MVVDGDGESGLYSDEGTDGANVDGGGGHSGSTWLDENERRLATGDEDVE